MPAFWVELRRRNVFKVGVAYAVLAWLLIQVANNLFPPLGFPDWTRSLVAVLSLIGFPIAIVLAWVYEITPNGIKPASDVDPGESVAHETGRRFNYVITGLLVTAVGLLVFEYFKPTGTSGEETAEASVAGAFAGTVAANTDQNENRRSIAVLPFENRSARGEDEFFVGGIHDDILTQLAKIGTLKVISRTSVMGYAEGNRNLRQIGEELDVATILEGAVQRAGDSVRINVQLIDARTDEHLWAETYDRALTAENIFAIQSDMATSIAAALQATLSPRELARLAEVPTQSLQAYDYYLSGNDYLRRPDNLTSYALASQQYQRAVEADPDFALAWAALSRAHSGVFFFRVDPTESRREMARAAMERAFELAPDLPEAHLALGFYRYHVFRDYDGALAEFAIAAQGMPAESIHLARSRIYRRTGEFRQAQASLERAIELDPRNLEQLSNLAHNYLMLRDYAASERYHDQMLEIAPDGVGAFSIKAYNRILRNGDVALAREVAADPPFDIGDWRLGLGWTAAIYDRDYDRAFSYLKDTGDEGIELQDTYAPKASLYGVTYQLAGDVTQAVRWFQTARTQVEQALAADSQNPAFLIALGEVLAGLGEREAATDTALRAVALMPTSRDALSGPAILLGTALRVHIGAGNLDQAIDQLDVYFAAPGVWSIEGLLPDPRLDPIRENPRFQALVAKYSSP